MERLTNKKEADAQRKQYEIRLASGYPRNIPEERFLKLAAYEDTLLRPEEITTEPYGCVFYCNRKCNLDGDFCAEGPGCPWEIDAETAKHMLELAQAEKDGRLVVLEPAAKEGGPNPPCFYNDMGQALCLGFARGECDDEPIDRCKECWYCESTREEAEAALKKREEAGAT